MHEHAGGAVNWLLGKTGRDVLARVRTPALLRGRWAAGEYRRGRQRFLQREIAGGAGCDWAGEVDDATTEVSGNVGEARVGSLVASRAEGAAGRCGADVAESVAV